MATEEPSELIGTSGRATPLAFDIWFEANYPGVVAAVCLVCMGDRAAAEDAAAEAFARAFEQWDKVALMANPEGWVVRVAMNGAKTSWKRSTRLMAKLLEPSSTAPDTIEPPALELLAEIEGLSKRQRKAVVLKYFEDYTQAQIADELGVTPGTAGATLTQARSRLRFRLAPDTTSQAVDPAGED